MMLANFKEHSQGMWSKVWNWLFLILQYWNHQYQELFHEYSRTRHIQNQELMNKTLQEPLPSHTSTSSPTRRNEQLCCSTHKHFSTQVYGLVLQVYSLFQAGFPILYTKPSVLNLHSTAKQSHFLRTRGLRTRILDQRMSKTERFVSTKQPFSISLSS